MIKKEIRVLGIACTTPHPMRTHPVQVIGVVYRGNRWLEGVMRTTAPPKLSDLTARIAKMITSSPHLPQLRVIALDELITKSGNYIDIEALSKKTRLPVIAVLRRRVLTQPLPKASTRRSQRALKHVADLPSMNWRAAGRPFFVYSTGLVEVDLVELLEVCASREGCPEAVRVARITTAVLGKFLMRRAS
jgi:endonuclease V-like protein UPF0215 family